MAVSFTDEENKYPEKENHMWYVHYGAVVIIRQSDSPTVRLSDGPIVRQSDSPTNALNWWKFWKIIWPKMIYS